MGRVRADLPAPARVEPVLRYARCCYDHLAGSVGIAITDSLVRAGILELVDGQLRLDEPAWATMAPLGLNRALSAAGRRPPVRGCLDWTERRPHLAGALGAAVAAELLGRGWLVRAQAGQRALLVTERGAAGLAETFGISGGLVPSSGA